MADGYTGAELFCVERDSRQDRVWTLIMPQCFQAASVLVLKMLSVCHQTPGLETTKVPG